MKFPKKAKKEFNKGFDLYLKNMGRDITVVTPPLSTDCPNCIFDSVRQKSSNVYDETFLRPVNIFPGTLVQKTVYPIPFNISTLPVGIEIDPNVTPPRILKTSRCPVCFGEGVLTSPVTYCIKALVTWNPKEKITENSGGRDGAPICRIKTFKCNYELILKSTEIIVDGIKTELHIPPRVKGLGADHIVEAYLITDEAGYQVSNNYDGDTRADLDTYGQASEQADVGTPTIPPTIPGDDPW